MSAYDFDIYGDTNPVEIHHPDCPDQPEASPTGDATATGVSEAAAGAYDCSCSCLDPVLGADRRDPDDAGDATDADGCPPGEHDLRVDHTGTNWHHDGLEVEVWVACHNDGCNGYWTGHADLTVPADADYDRSAAAEARQIVGEDPIDRMFEEDGYDPLLVDTDDSREGGA